MAGNGVPERRTVCGAAWLNQQRGLKEQAGPFLQGVPMSDPAVHFSTMCLLARRRYYHGTRCKLEESQHFWNDGNHLTHMHDCAANGRFRAVGLLGTGQWPGSLKGTLNLFFSAWPQPPPAGAPEWSQGLSRQTLC